MRIINFFAQPAPSLLDFLFPVLIIGGAFVIGIIVFLFRDQIKDRFGFGGPSKTLLEQEIEQRLVQIRQLARQQMFREASILMWQTMTLASQGFLGVGRAPNESARQLGVKLMNRGDLDPSAINAIVMAFEKANGF
jgi:hypothetical protein